nr:MAG TPA: hypothetical protein [Bacteriophage sp.]
MFFCNLPMRQNATDSNSATYCIGTAIIKTNCIY